MNACSASSSFIIGGDANEKTCSLNNILDTNFLKEAPEYSKTYNKFKEDENLEIKSFNTINKEDIIL